MNAAPGIAAEKDVCVRGLQFRIIETENGWPGRGDIFVFRLRADGKYHEEFCGFRSFWDAEEYLACSDEVATWAGFVDAKQTPAPVDRTIEATGFSAWRQPASEDENGPIPECGGQDPFSGPIRWQVSVGWAGWVWADCGLAVSSDITAKVVVTRWKEVLT